MFVQRQQPVAVVGVSQRLASSPVNPLTDQPEAVSGEPKPVVAEGKQELSFNINRLVIAAVLLVVMLVFAIGTAFFKELAQIHTMLVHAFELVLGLIAGLLGGEVIARENG